MKTVLIPALVLLLTLPAPAQTEALPGRLSLLDRDGDNRISQEEAGDRPFFRIADRNSDGFVTAGEAAQLMKRAATPGAPPTTPPGEPAPSRPM